MQILRASDNKVITEWVTELYDYEFPLSPGEYIMHEKTPVDGFAAADDIAFTVNPDGSVMVSESPVSKVSMLDEELVDIKGTKSWQNDSASNRPESITVNLLQNGVKIDSAVVTAADDWKYEFESFSGACSGLCCRFNDFAHHCPI